MAAKLAVVILILSVVTIAEGAAQKKCKDIKFLREDLYSEFLQRNSQKLFYAYTNNPQVYECNRLAFHILKNSDPQRAQAIKYNEMKKNYPKPEDTSNINRNTATSSQDKKMTFTTTPGVGGWEVFDVTKSEKKTILTVSRPSDYIAPYKVVAFDKTKEFLCATSCEDDKINDFWCVSTNMAAMKTMETWIKSNTKNWEFNNLKDIKETYSKSCDVTGYFKDPDYSEFYDFLNTFVQ